MSDDEWADEDDAWADGDGDEDEDDDAWADGPDDDWGGDPDDDWGGEPEDDWGDDGGIEDPEEEDIRLTIRNLFYQADNMQKRQPQEALGQFLQMYNLEQDSDEFKGEVFMRFQALEKIVALEMRLNQPEEMLKHYNQLLELTALVSPNEAQDAINITLRNSEKSEDVDAIEQLYLVTRDHLRQRDARGVTFFNVSMKLVNRCMERADFDRAEEVLEELHSRCLLENGEDDESKGSQLLGIYAKRIQIYTHRGEEDAIKKIFYKTKRIGNVVADPHYMSIVQECWGKVHASDGNWDQAYSDFWEAFLQYQQVTSPRAKQCLKYVVIAEMLCSKSINPFNSREAKVLEDEKEIAVMVKLRNAYDQNDVRSFQELVALNKDSVLNDPFIKHNLEPLILQSRAQTLIKLLKPYQRVDLGFLASNLQIEVDEVEKLLVQLILDNKIYCKIDQVNGILDLSQEKKSGQKFGSLEQWSGAISRLADSFSSVQ